MIVVFGVHDAEVDLGVGIALLGRLAVPFHCLAIVLRHALAFVVRETEGELGSGKALLGGLTGHSR